TLPDGASLERTVAALQRCSTALQDMKGVQDVLALADHPFDRVRNQPCILVRLAAVGRKQAREQLIQAIRTRLGEEADMVLRVRGLSGSGRFPRAGYAIDLALTGPEQNRLAEWAEKLAERLRHSPKLTDAAVCFGARPRPQLFMDIDRTAAQAKGVSLDDIFT